MLNLALFSQTMNEMVVLKQAEFRPDQLINASRKDAMGRVCAGILIMTDLTGLAFESNNGVVDVSYQPGRYMVFVSEGERVLDVYKDGFRPLEIILSEYGIYGLKSGQVYQLDITSKEKDQAKTLPVVFNVTPADATIKVGRLQFISGQAQSLPIGENEVVIEKEGYRSIKEKITVDNNNILFTYDMERSILDNEKEMNEMAFKIVRDLYLKPPSFAYYKSYKGNNYIFTYLDRKLIIFKEFAKTWQKFNEINLLDYQDKLQDHLNKYGQYDLTDDILIYVLTLDPGMVLGTVFFNVYSLKDNTVYTISGFGPLGEHNDLTIPEDLTKKRPDILTFLENMISESGYVHIPIDEDLDINLIQNVTKYWQIENEDIHNLLNSQPNIFFSLNIKKYSTNDLILSQSFSRWFFENEFYEITSYHKENIYLYNKKENNICILWVPAWNYDWTEKIEFITNHIIVLYDRFTDKPNYKIDLENLRIMKLE
jgi:hypothetical protein